MVDNEIAIFNKEWQVIAFVSTDDLNVLGWCEPGDKSLISWVTKQLEDRDPQLMEPVKDESGCIIGFLSVGKGETRFLEATRDEFRRVGLRAHVVGQSLVPLFKKISTNKSFDHVRPQVVPEVLGLDVEHAKMALEAVMQKQIGEVSKET